MATDITGFGLVAHIIADPSFPVGFPVTHFADDSDPLDIAQIQIADAAMGLNGDLVRWARAAIIPVTISLIPGGVDDTNMQLLADANRVAQGKPGTQDAITMNLVYPDGRIINLTGGVLVNASIGLSVSNSGRLKTRTYVFNFENKTGA